MLYKDFLVREKTNPRFTPFLIAEAGVNHEGKMEYAKRMVLEAAEAGADAIKFQTYKAETLASRTSPAYWDLSKEPIASQFMLFKKHDSFWKNEFEVLKFECDKAGIEFMSTAFDIESALFLNELMGVIKISSSDITNKPFIAFLSRYHKPIILSVGASDLVEISNAIKWIGNQATLSLMHCVLNYPTLDENAHLAAISALKKRFPDNIIGYSDHTMPSDDMHILITASLLGARIIEKHFTFDKTLKGNDHYHAMDKNDLSKYINKMNELERILGKEEINYQQSEEIARENARRSLVAARNIETGHCMTELDITWKRPGSGIPPNEIDLVIGKRVKRDISEDTTLQWDMFG